MSEFRYMEVAKECPRCHKMTLFLRTRIKKITYNLYEGILGVKCVNNKVTKDKKLIPCGYEADLTKVLQDE